MWMELLSHHLVLPLQTLRHQISNTWHGNKPTNVSSASCCPPSLKKPWLKSWASPPHARFGLPWRTLSVTDPRLVKFVSRMTLMKRGTRTISEYARAFKAICDQLHAIGRAVDGTDKIWCPKQRALSSSKSHWSLLPHPLQRLLPLIATPKNRISGTTPLTTFKVALVATVEGRDASLEDAPRVVRYAVWKATMRTDAGNGMITMVMPLKLSLPKPSLHHVLSLAMRHQIGIQELRPTDRPTGVHFLRNSLATTFKHNFTPLASIINSLVPIHPHKTVKQKGNIVITAAYIINRLPTPLLRGKSPFELLYGSSPNYENFHPFGCRVYPCLCNYMTNKFSLRSIPCIFMGYSSSHKGFRCLDPTTSRIYITRHAQFDEHHFPFHHTSQAQPISSLQISNFLEPSLSHTDMSPPSPAPHSQHIPQSESNPCIICTDPVNEFVQAPISYAGPSLSHSNSSTAFLEPVTEAPTSAASSSSHPMLTRAKADEEIQALQSNRTWILVPRPANTNIVGSKWVFRTKYLPDGSIERLKARLVAKGYTQVPGLDYTDTFSPVIKATTVRVVLCLTPPGYIDPRFPNHVCQLKKALYGLKQAPRAWFQRFSSFLLQLGFYCSRADTSLFVFHKHSDMIYLLLYVDDIILTGNNPSLLEKFTCRLNSEFTTKDLGSLSYFLGLEATPTTNGLFISQLKYAHDILIRAQLLDSKPVHTPMVVSQHLSADSPLFSDPTLYRSLVGALQYLTITRPDIAHAVNSISQFLHSPTDHHYLAVKRMLRYVKGTLHFGLTFHPSIAPGALVAYSDADWAGCPDTRRSTSGYSIYLGDNLVSWSAKKQPTISRSSCEFEYRALALTAAEILWLTHLLRDLRVSHSQPPLLLCDNKSAIFLSSNPVSHKRAKHVELDYHFLRELVLTGKLRTQYVPSHLQVADIFTKSVSRPLFDFFRSKLHVRSNPTLSLRGGVEDHVKDSLP
uniref:Uncharacterized protein n=1 Tax=Fagus sylvatica TaxID=28930 RepID=A0A2N9HKD0_FAGSY